MHNLYRYTAAAETAAVNAAVASRAAVSVSGRPLRGIAVPLPAVGGCTS
jgi:hypothetical protein